MLVDLSTIHELELIQNSQDPHSNHSLFGILNHTMTAMGVRKLRSTILQPSTDPVLLESRWAALTELASKEGIFLAVKQGKCHSLGSNPTNGRKR